MSSDQHIANSSLVEKLGFSFVSHADGLVKRIINTCSLNFDVGLGTCDILLYGSNS